MNKELKSKWIKALTSGKYKQGHDKLVDDLGNEKVYCCLGVLRHIVDPNDKRSSLYGHSQFLSREQLKEFDLADIQQYALAELNDEEIPFEVIAGFIEETL